MGRYKLTYIYHDCFLLETAEAVFLFDYWKDPLSVGKDKDFPPLLDEIPEEKSLYLVISHHHKDHFSRRVFLWAQKFPNIRYIISQDVFTAVKYLFRDGGNYQGYRPPRDCVTVLKHFETYNDGIVRIKAYPSTDIGNSYAIECNGYRFFHAGDLNAWLWLDESTPEEVEDMRTQFTGIVKEIASDYESFDLALFPVDSRQGRDYWWGAKYFVEAIKVGLFVPMHFELVLEEDEKEQRRIDAAAFNFFARSDYGAYLQLSSTRSSYFSPSD